MTIPSLTATLADFCADIGFQALDSGLAGQTGLLLLDFLGVAARGILSPSTQAMLQAHEEMGQGEGELPIIGTTRKASAPGFALIHGAAAHSLELDDLHNASSLHPGVAVFPAACAAAQLTQAQPADFVAAVVAGYEAATRLGEAVNPATHYERGFHPTATCGVFGAATAAGKIFKLSAEKIGQAWGICGSMASGSMAFLSGETWTKHLNAGWASQAGLTAAMLARHAYRAPKAIIEEPLGFLHAYAEEPRPDRLVAKLGERWAVLETSLKPHACCRYMQPAIDGLITLAEENDLDPMKVASVTVHCLPAGFRLIAEPPEQKADPQRTTEAQFSMPFGAAVALVRRRAGLDEFGEDALRDPAIRSLLPKIRCIKSEELGKMWPERWSAEVEVKTTDGGRFNQRVENPKGDPTNPFTEAELVEKFLELTAPCLPAEQRERLAEAAKGVGRLKTMDTLWELFPFRG